MSFSVQVDYISTILVKAYNLMQQLLSPLLGIHQMGKAPNCFLKRKHYILAAVGVMNLQDQNTTESLRDGIYRFMNQTGLSYTETDVENIKQAFLQKYGREATPPNKEAIPYTYLHSCPINDQKVRDQEII